MPDEYQQKSTNRPPQPSQPQNNIWRYLLWFVVILFVFFYLQNLNKGPPAETIPYTQFKQDISEGKVSEVTLRGHEVVGEFKQQPGTSGKSATEKTPATNTNAARKQQSHVQFYTMIPSISDPTLMPLLEKQNVTIKAESQKNPWWFDVVIGVLPWILFLGLIFYASRKMQERMMQGGSGIFSFGKSRARRFRKGGSDITFNDVAGLENAKLDLREIIDYLKDPQRFRMLGAKIPKGVLLIGPPGVGKTMLARAVAGEADTAFYSISASEFIEMFVGVGASRVRDLFESAKKEAPSIIFIDELDSVGRARGTGIGGGHDEREQTLNQILSEMDGFSPNEAVVVLAATNRPDVLDAALLRPGRFDRKVTLDMPEKMARKKILEVHVRHVPLADDIDFDKLAARTVGFSGADLENLVNEAALLAGRSHKQKVDMATMEAARDKIVFGAERETIISDDEKKLIAYHESGHALMAWLLPQADPLDKVTIIPRGQALGLTEQLPEIERHNLTRSYLLDRIAVMLGGRVSESIVFGDITSGAEQDLKQATRLALRMVSQWGMSEKLGPVAYQRGEEHVFLGKEMAQQRDFSETTAELIDQEVRKLIDEMEHKAYDVLTKNRRKLDTLAEALLKAETLSLDQITNILNKEYQSSKVASPQLATETTDEI